MGEQSGGSRGIIASYATGSANGGEGQYDYVGGLVGRQDGGSIIASYATGDADGGGGISDIAGGLVGYQDGGSIIASYAADNANGGEFVGRLVGRRMDGGAITASYGFGTATGTTINTIGDTSLDVNAFTASDAGMQWGGSPSPWIFSSGLAPRLGYITDASISGDDVNYECEADELIEGIACGEPLRGQ